MNLRQLKTDLGPNPSPRLKRWFNRVARRRLAAGKWVCKICTYTNTNDAAKRCDVCLARRKKKKKRKRNKVIDKTVIDLSGEEEQVIDLSGEEEQVIDLSGEEEKEEEKKLKRKDPEKKKQKRVPLRVSSRKRTRTSRGFYPRALPLKKINLRQELKKGGSREKKSLLRRFVTPTIKATRSTSPRSTCFKTRTGISCTLRNKNSICAACTR